MSEPSRVGSLVAGKYRLEEELGRGGMGAVYRARHVAVHKDFAIKLLLGNLVERKSIVSRFFLEAQAAGRIGHAGILDVYDVGEDTDGSPFIVMELLSGEPLSSLIQRGPVDIDAACWIAMEVLDVLTAAHQAGIIHRDVKPQNVFMTERAAASGPASSRIRGVKLLDFGIAKFTGGEGNTLTRSGEIIGSPLYMAPEQAKGEEGIDARADVWSVGAMLFEMLTGKCAHVATSPVAVLARILTERAPAPSTRRDGIPPSLDAIVERALEIDRTKRFGSAREMYDALAAVRSETGRAGTAPSLPPAQPRPKSISPDAEAHTPGAISSTVLERGLAVSAGRRDGDPNAAQSTETSLGTPRGRARLALMGGIALVAGAALFVSLRSSGGEHSASADAGDMPIRAASLPSAPVENVRPAASAEPPRETAAVDAAPATAAADATPPTRPSAPAAPAAATTAPSAGARSPKCEPGEVTSNGHCCPRGLAWQDGRCERPLATTF